MQVPYATATEDTVTSGSMKPATGSKSVMMVGLVSLGSAVARRIWAAVCL